MDCASQLFRISVLRSNFLPSTLDPEFTGAGRDKWLEPVCMFFLPLSFCKIIIYLLFFAAIGFVDLLRHNYFIANLIPSRALDFLSPSV